MKENYVRIRYSGDETGWAERVGENRYRIDNIPLATDLNIDDVVACEEKDYGLHEITDVLERIFTHKSGVNYEKKEQYAALREKVKAAGFKIEGMVGPSHFGPGICVIAHNESFDVKSLIKEIGIESEQFREDEVTVLVE